MSETKNIKKVSCTTPKQSVGFDALFIVGIVILILGIVIIIMFSGYAPGTDGWNMAIFGGGLFLAVGIIMTIYGLARRFCWF